MTNSQWIVALWLVVLLVMCLLMIACGTLTTLQAVVDATEVAVPILEAAGVPIPASVVVYVSAVANCIGSQTGSPTPAQLAHITSCLASQVVPALPTGLPQEIAAVVQQVAAAVEKYLTQQKSTVKPVEKITITQAGQIQAMRQRARSVAQRLATVRATKVPIP